MRIRGQLAACSGKNELYVNVPSSDHRDYCGFMYGQMATPTVTMVTPALAVSGATVTLSGTGFSEISAENFVMFGDVECAVMSSSATSIGCQLGSGFAGFKGLYLHVFNSGVAETGALGITYNLALNEISPSSGSQMGGTEVTIAGSGFYEQPSSDAGSAPMSFSQEVAASLNNDACPSGWRNQVSIGDRPCTVVHSGSTSLTVITPAELAPGSGSPAYDLEVSVVCPDNSNISSTALLSGAFTYDPVSTPSLLTIAPSTGAVQGGQIVTISGQGFSPDSAANEVLVSTIEFAVLSKFWS